MKRLMSLGGNYFQMTAVKAAKRLGHYVIDVDYLPSNPAHKLADEYHNVSTLDMEGVLALARELNIDGIISYASDVSAPTAAYVAERMGLPTNPFSTVDIMARKDLFHPFLKTNGFFIPEGRSFDDLNELHEFYEKIGMKPIMVKPIHSSGSKGVSVVSSKEEIVKAYNYAKEYARGEVLVAEEFVERDSYQIAGDAFVIDGKIVYFGFANEHFNTEINGIVPIGESFPANLNKEHRIKAEEELQKAITALGFRNGAVNMDFMFTKDGRVFIIELGPRNGGNLISDAIAISSGIDLAELTVKIALGEDLKDLPEMKMKRYIASYIWHSNMLGKFDSISVSNKLIRRTVLSELFVKKGDIIQRYTHGGYGIGAALLEFKSNEEMLYMMEHMCEYYKVNVSSFC